MSKFTVKFADVTIGIESIFPQVEQLCKDYISNENPDFTIISNAEDIAKEQERSDAENKFEGLPQTKFPQPYLEELSVYRKIAEKMPGYGVFLFHGSVIAVDGKAYLFTAKSGTGKSTHTRLWRQLLGERAVMVNDDKPLLKVTDGAVYACGTPYNGKHNLGENISIPLAGLCILNRSPENHIERITKSAAYPMLIQQMYRPADMAMFTKTLSLIDKLSACVPLYSLGCNMDISAAELSYGTMSRNAE